MLSDSLHGVAIQNTKERKKNIYNIITTIIINKKKKKKKKKKKRHEKKSKERRLESADRIWRFEKRQTKRQTSPPLS